MFNYTFYDRLVTIFRSILMLGVTQDEFAKRLKVKRSTINDYESNLVLPSGTIILKLVDIIGSNDLMKDSYYEFIICNNQKEFLDWRLRNNYSLRKAAEIFGLPVKTYAAIEKCKSIISRHTFNPFFI